MMNGRNNKENQATYESTKIMYIAPRFHTNMIPIIQGWKSIDVPVVFMAQYEAPNEIHDGVVYHQIKESIVSRIIKWFLKIKNDDSIVTHKMIYAFVPSIIDLFIQIRNNAPDIVIMRERNKTTAIANLACMLLGIKKRVLYIQTPLYGRNKTNTIRKALQKIAFPKVIYSPILFKGIRDCPDMTKNTHEWFVPLVATKMTESKKQYCQGGKVHILDIGKYQDYKNHFFLVDALDTFEKADDIIVTIVGQGKSVAELEYKRKLIEHISNKGLSNIIHVVDNIPYQDMQHVYERNDVLILPSKGEGAGMVILEAMGHGLCVLSSIYCGLSSYVKKEECGIVFDLNTTKELTDAIRQLLNDKTKIEEYGRNAAEATKRHYSFENYFSALQDLCQQEFGYFIHAKMWK